MRAATGLVPRLKRNLMSERFWRRLSVRSLVLAAGLAFAPPLHAAEPGDKVENIEELDLEQLLGTVTAASRTEESVLTAPATVTVLDQDDIRPVGRDHDSRSVAQGPRRAGARARARRLSGLAARHRRPDRQQRRRPARRHSAQQPHRRQRRLVGHPDRPPQIDRIEIVRGPVSTIYGPDAYTGVINIVSMAPVEETGSPAARHVGAGVDVSGKPVGVAAGIVSGTNGKLSGRLSVNGRYDTTFAAPAGPITPNWARGGGTALSAVRVNDDARSPSSSAGVQPSQLARPPRPRVAAAGQRRTVFGAGAPRHARAAVDARHRSRSGSACARCDDSHASVHRLHLRGANSGDEEIGFDLRFELAAPLQAVARRQRRRRVRRRAVHPSAGERHSCARATASTPTPAWS